MGKHGKYEKHYNKAWESLPEFSAWITKNPDPNAICQEAYCKFCETGLRAHKTDLQSHANTIKHRRFAASFQKQKKLSSFGVNVTGNVTKSAELKLSVFIALHCAVKSIDHLGELAQLLGKKSDLENIRIHRTKCSRLITNVISPAILRLLVDDVGDKPYSLIIDESTDISVQKHLALCIRYFSIKEEKIMTDFLRLVTVTDATADSLYQHITSYLKSVKRPIKNLISIGTDGASNLVGVKHSLFTLLRDDVPLPHFILIRCVSHSLHLCASEAADVLPAHLEYLIRESRNWFSCSPKRMPEYEELYHLINDNNKTMLALIQLCEERWLAFNGAVIRILEQFLELKTHFKMVAARNENKCHTARHLALIYDDPANQLYLFFLKSILQEVSEVNILFQSTERDIYKLYESLWSLVLSVASRIIKAPFIEKAKLFENINLISEALDNKLALKLLNEMNCGVEFHRFAVTSKLKSEVLNEVLVRCHKYLLILCTELVTRMPNNVEILKTSAKFSPLKILNITTKPSVTDIPSALIDDSMDLVIIENQLRKITFIDWKQYFSDEIVTDSSKFWPHIYGFKDASGKQQFKDLALVVLKMLSLPISNAVVERVFSIMNAVKTKIRNRMHLDMLTAILRIQIYCYARKL